MCIHLIDPELCFRKDEKARREPKSKAEASAAVPEKSWGVREVSVSKDKR